MKKIIHVLIPSAILLSILSLTGCRKNNDKIILPPEDVGNIILVAPYPDIDTGELLALDSSGNEILKKNIKGAVMNFKRWNINGNTRYSYFQYNSSYTIPVIGTALGEIVIIDAEFHELKRIRLLPNNIRMPEDPDLLDAHDFILIDDNHYIIMTYYLQTVHNIPPELNPVTGPRVLAPIIQEVQNGEAIWEWNGADYPEFYANSAESNFADTAIQDHMHLNSLFIDPRDNNIICSFRNQDQVIKINRRTGDIVWRLGGKNSDFPLTADQHFLRQHHATLINDNHTLLLYDNGEINQRPYSRILEFTLDEMSKTVTDFKSVKVPENTFSQFMGSVQKRNNTYFIGCGSVPKIMEIDANTGQLLFQKELTSQSYRAFKY
jgi:hypothetical protein